MNCVEKMNKRGKLSYDDYNDRYSGTRKRNKQKRGNKHRFTEE